MTAPEIPTTALHIGVHDPTSAVVAAVVGCTLAALGWWYLAGLGRVLDHPQARHQRAQAPATLAGVAALVVVTMPPLGEHLDQRLWSHMLQHLVIITVAAPLIAYGAPGRVLLAGLPPSLRRPVVTAVHRLPVRTSAVLSAWSVGIATIWVWHLPPAYDAAVRSEAVHLLEHLTFFLGSWFFWAALVRLARSPGKGVVAAAYVAAAVPPGAALGAVLTFADHPLYPAQAAQARAAGIDPLLDQQIAGIVMWVPLDLVYLAVAISLFARWFRAAVDAAPADPGRTLPRDARPDHEEARP
jgi:putative membrane protein